MQQNMEIPELDGLSGLSWKEKLAYLTHQFLTMEQTGCPLTHRFEQNLYIREIRIPAGTLLIGSVHRHGHVSQLLEGSVILVHPQGHREAFQAPSQILSMPGYQMVVYALTDVLAQTIHPNPHDERDIAVLEADIYEPVDELKQLGARVAYRMMLLEHGIDEAKLKPLIDSLADQIPFKREWPLRVGPSLIEGDGLFATAKINSGELIAPARIGGKRTPAGRYTNHAFTPNAKMRAVGNGDVDLVALEPIPEEAEITVDYREAIKAGRQA
jgi:hypothetical protein